MNKVIRDGKVAVLYSPRYGAGWYSWNNTFPQCLFEPKIVEAIESGYDTAQLEKLAHELFGDDFYAGGARDLVIKWLPEGTPFRVHEYDGSETIKYADDDVIVA
jgi:hypothetical protein